MLKNISILVIEDELRIIDIIRIYLEKEGYNVYHAFEGKDILNKINEIKPNLIILDLMLPDISGEEICKSIRKKSEIPIIMLTAKVDEESILNGFDLGADDYVTKPFSPRQLLARVNALLRRTSNGKNRSSNILSFNNKELQIDMLKYEVKKNGVKINLTSTEYKIISLLASNPNKVFTREELVCSVFSDCYDGFDRIIDTHIKNTRKKIETNPKKPHYVITAHGIGYRFGGEDY